MSETQITPADWGRFTHSGSETVEAYLRDSIAGVIETIQPHLRPEAVRALVLIGGYGRGEGGVEVRPDGQEYPHNNLDFLLIGRGSMAEAAALKREIDPILERLSLTVGIGLDLGITTEAKLSTSPCLIMWYDMRFGHKTLWGDAHFVPSLSRFEADQIPAYEARNLLVNRGTLLVINDAIRERGIRNENDRRTIVKHAVKAIIGYGDALLYFRGDYHWSYAEKQHRMADRTDVPANFKALYGDALRFRFRPDYATWRDADSEAWAEELRHALSPVHLICERARLQRSLSWENYLEVAFTGEGNTGGTTSLRAVAKRVVNIVRSELPAEAVATLPRFAARWGARAAGPKGVLPILFPVIAYHLADEPMQETTRLFLGASDTSLSELRRGYLHAWGVHGDINFGTVLRKLGLSVEKTAAVTTDYLQKEAA